MKVGMLSPQDLKQGKDVLITPIQHHTGSFSQCNTARKRKKTQVYRKEEMKLFLFTDDIITFIENHKDSTIKVPTNKLSSACLHTGNMQKFYCISTY